jgi:starch synthase
VRVDIVSKEFPPEIYGGAGVHVAELSRVLAGQVELNVHCFGAPRPGDYHGAKVRAYGVPEGLTASNAAVQTLGTDLEMLGNIGGADLVHSHTWYANMAGHLASLLHGIPHVLSAHSLEPLRPWKAEQLGGGYALSSWAEKTSYEAAAAVIAVSAGMREDILRSYPLVDPGPGACGAQRHRCGRVGPGRGRRRRPVAGHRPGRPSVVFVGRNTRQKGVPYLLRAAAKLPAEVQLVLVLGAADTKELAAETEKLISELQEQRGSVVLIERMLPRRELVQVLSHATAFACPSIYEPLGIVNLEAMACGAAVVASAVAGSRRSSTTASPEPSCRWSR